MDMNGPLCRLAAATCLVIMAMVTGPARAEPIRVTEPTSDYPDLAGKPTDAGEEQESLPVPDTTIIEWPVVADGAEPLPVVPPVLPVKAEDEVMHTLSGAGHECPCVCPPTPQPPTPPGPTTPAETAPEPSTLVLLGLGSLGLAVARRRRG
jgi:hypothetical protein